MTPSLPFGCTRCRDALAGQRRAEAMTGRLLSLLALSEAREARQRTEIADLEQRLTRHTPKWEAS